MYEPRYIQYLNLPLVPQELIDQLSRNFDEYEKSSDPVYINHEHYWWSKSFNEEINAWCQQNICADMYFGFQAATGILRIHKDPYPKVKLNYLIEPGGDNVLTEFFSEDHSKKLASYQIEPNRWHLIDVKVPHHIINTEPGKIRFAITGRVFTDTTR
jgi:hypothetical protein